MTREEILAKSRNENRGNDERERKIALQASTAAKISGMAVCVLISFIARYLGCPQHLIMAVWTVYWGMMIGEYWYLFIRLRKRFHLVAAIVNTVACILCGWNFADFFRMGF